MIDLDNENFIRMVIDYMMFNYNMSEDEYDITKHTKLLREKDEDEVTIHIYTKYYSEIVITLEDFEEYISIKRDEKIKGLGLK